MKCEFSEREFEFGLNCELFCMSNAYLHIPSQQEETTLGYDVHITDFQYSLFLQYKVPFFCTQRKNNNMYHLFNTPYFWFYLNKHQHYNFRQHNLLCELTYGGESAFYVAPLFNEFFSMLIYQNNRTIFNNSIFFNPSEIGFLPENDDTKHKIMYNQQGTLAYFHSTPQPITPINKPFLLNKRNLKKDYFLKIYELILKTLKKHSNNIVPKLSAKSDANAIYKECYFLLKKKFKIIWLLF